MSPRVCPCGGGAYADCCGPLHDGVAQAETAEQLMRSRYSAFARGLADYLLTTWHPATRPALLELDDHTVWTGLTVESVTGGRAWEDTGTVTFTASWSDADGGGSVRETSRFVFEGGRWLYVDGDAVAG